MILVSVFMLILGFMVYGTLFLRVLEVLAVVLLLIDIRCSRKSFSYLVIVFSCVAVSVALALLRNEHYPYDMPFVALAVAMYILTHSFNLPIIRIGLIVSGLVLFYILTNATSPQQLTGGVPLFEGSGASLNAISFTILSFASVIYLIEYKQKGQLSIWPALFTLFLSVVSLCRTGVVCSFILSCFVIYKRLNNRDYIIVTIILLLIAAYAFIQNLDYFEVYFDAIENKASGSYFENPRSEMLLAFVRRLDLEALLFGVDLDTIPAIAYWGNPHNSFIRIIANSGIVAFFYLFIGVKSLLYYYKKCKQLLVVFLVLLLRAWTDVLFGGTIYDFSLYLFILYPFVNCNYSIFKSYGAKRFISDKISVSDAMCIRSN